MPTSTTGAGSLHGLMTLDFKGRRLFGNACNGSAELRIAATQPKKKPRSATISFLPNAKRATSPLLTSGWFARPCDGESIASRLQAPSPAPPASALATADQETVMPASFEEEREQEERGLQHELQQAIEKELEQHLLQEQNDKLQRRRRSFFFKKRKGNGADYDNNAAVDVPPMPLSPLPRSQHMMTKQLRERRLQDEQHLAALERVSDLVCLAVEDKVDSAAATIERRPSAASNLRLMSASNASLASRPSVAEGDERVLSPLIGSSSAPSTDGSWPSDGAESPYLRSPPSQSVLDQVLLPSSMKTIKRERRKPRPPPLEPTAEVGRRFGLSYRASLDTMMSSESEEVFFESSQFPRWVRAEHHGPAPPPRPCRAHSQRVRTASLSTFGPLSSQPSRLSAVGVDGEQPRQRLRFSAASSHQSVDDDSAAGAAYANNNNGTRPRMSLGDLNLRSTTTMSHPPDADYTSPFSTPTFGHEYLWSRVP
ncbi:hypothetical protein ACQY0O_001319 [Thecaphora frezii]